MDATQWLTEIPVEGSDRNFLVDTTTGEALTFRDYDEKARILAAEFLRRGVRKGDRVAIVMHNSATLATIYLACLYSGIVTVPVNPIFAASEVDFILRNSGVKLLLASCETANTLNLDRMRDQGMEVVIVMDGREGSPDGGGTTALDPGSLKADPIVPFAGVSATDPMTIVYTSGTTSRPSGVAHTITSMIDNARLFNQRLGIGPENRFYGILSMTYLGGYYNLLMLPYAAGASVVLCDTFSARSALRFWDSAVEHNVNTLWFVPTILSILMEMDRGDKGERFCRDAVDLSLVGTAPLPPSLRQEFEARYGVTLYENYGLSETFFITTNARSIPRNDGCVGRSLPGVEVTVLDTNGVAVDYDKEGEIHTRTPFLMEGYYDPDRGEPNPIDRDDWFPTGDIGYQTSGGDLYITGRMKDLIIRGGVNVSPASIEDVLYAHPDVLECAVVGVPHPTYGEDIAAAVRLREGAEFDQVEASLSHSARTELGGGRRPGVVVELESFPHSSSGKIQKNRVRELLIEKLNLGQTVLQTRPADPAGPSIIPGRVELVIDRPPTDLLDKMKAYPSSIVSDCLNRMQTVDGRIRSLSPGRRFCGPALTIEEPEGGNLMSHIALEMIEPGDVLVIDAKGVTSRSTWGGLQTQMAIRARAAALIVDGVVRDVDDICASELPVFALGSSPAGPLKGWAGNVNHTVSVGGAVVRPGDIVIGDDDGVVVVPLELAPRLPAMCEERLKMESSWSSRIDAGESTLDIVGLRKTVKDLGIEFTQRGGV